MFLGLPDSDPLVRGTDPDPSLLTQYFSKKVKFLRLKIDKGQKDEEKKYFYTSLKSLKKGVGSGTISQSYESADPYLRQNVTDPQCWCRHRTQSNSKNN